MAHLLQNNRSWDSCSSNLWETQVSLGEQMMHQGISHTMVKLSLQETHNQVLHLEVVYSRCYCKTDVIVLVMNGKAATLQEFCPWIHMNNQWTLTCVVIIHNKNTDAPLYTETLEIHNLKKTMPHESWTDVQPFKTTLMKRLGRSPSALAESMDSLWSDCYWRRQLLMVVVQGSPALASRPYIH